MSPYGSDKVLFVLPPYGSDKVLFVLPFLCHTKYIDKNDQKNWLPNIIEANQLTHKIHTE